MLTNKTIELIEKSLDLMIEMLYKEHDKEETKKAKEEFKEYICDLEDLREMED